jgi:hypothetical protein
MEVGKSLIGLGVGIGAGAIAGLAGYGLYGVLRERGMTPLKAGASTGAINGAIGGIALMVLAAMDKEGQTMAGYTVQQMKGVTVAQLPKAMGLVAAKQLSGIQAQVF